MQYVCEVHRDKLGDRLGRYHFTLSFIGWRLIAASVEVIQDLNLGYKFSDEPELQMPPPENNVAIVSMLWSQIYEEVEDTGKAKAQSARKNKGQIKRKKVGKSNGKNKRRKK